MPKINRIRAMASKEIYHIFRDPRTLAIVFLMPILQLIIFGYAMNMEIRGVPLVIDDHAKNSFSKSVCQAFEHTPYFKVIPIQPVGYNPEQLFRERKAQATLSIPEGYGITAMNLLLKVDASDPNTAQLIQSYALGIVTKAGQGDIDIRPFILYNPDLKSSFFFVPGLIAMILVMICALLTSISISREKEMGTLEQILVSPVSATEILIGKVIPYIVLGLADALLILGVGMLLFKVPFSGNFMVFMGFTFLYVLCALCLGLLVSTIAKTQQAAMMMALAITLLPTLLLSGYLFPIPSMPILLQKLTYIIPARYYLVIIRGIMLKGNSFAELYQAGLCLAGMSFLMLIVAVKRFKLRLA